MYPSRRAGSRNGGGAIGGKRSLPTRALPDTYLRWDHDRFGRRQLVLLVDPLEVKLGGFPPQRYAMLVDCRKRRGHELGKGLVGKTEDTQFRGDGNAEGRGSIHYAQGLVVGYGKDRVRAVGELQQGQCHLLSPLAGERIVDDEIVRDGQVGFRNGRNEAFLTILEGLDLDGAAEKRNVPVAFADKAPDGFIRCRFVVVDDLETVEGIQATVELNDGDLVLCYLPEMMGIGRFFGNGDQDTVDVLMDKGLDDLSFYFVRLMRLTNDEAVFMRETNFLDAGYGVGEETLVDMRDDHANGPGAAPSKIGGAGIMFIVELFGLFPDALPDGLSYGLVVVQGLGHI